MLKNMRNFVMDHDVERILLATYKQDRSTSELSDLYGIPIARCHRKISEMRRIGLIDVSETIINEKGKKTDLYRANLKSAYVSHEGGKLKITWKRHVL